MATSNITNTTTDPTGAVVANVPVTITLYGQATGSVPTPVAGFRISDGSEVVQTTSLTSNASGVWTAALERNANITPANTFYIAVENFPVANGGPRFWFFSVGASDQTLQAAIVNPAPSLAATTFLTQATADARYVLAPGSFSGSVATSTPGDAGTAGVATSYSRGDHQHQRIDGYGLVGSITSSYVGDTAAAGTSANLARADHKHARELVPSTTKTGITALTTSGSTVSTLVTQSVTGNSKFQLYIIQWNLAFITGTVAADTFDINVRIDGANASVARAQVPATPFMLATYAGSWVYIDAAGGNHTFDITLARQAGTGTATSSSDARNFLASTSMFK
jgi:hypothetical protein